MLLSGSDMESTGSRARTGDERGGAGAERPLSRADRGPPVKSHVGPRAGVCSLSRHSDHSGMPGVFSTTCPRTGQRLAELARQLAGLMSPDSRLKADSRRMKRPFPVSYTHLRAHETDSYL